ncbi:hypothetical protein GJ744_000182 [Endocarpon pusillum]|uniref:Uncharacterized protein n=1 Tax=Endocarpon pusillum TaxID=364733 RepID=A0A8H7AU41_9EURO|nr:hypothetical protein GJ744_000182 [Endocarpon pusillum]
MGTITVICVTPNAVAAELVVLNMAVAGMALFTAVKAASQILASVTMPWSQSRRIVTVSHHRLAYPKRHHLLWLNQSQKNITVG